jgi:raffinose/stachyose/melibiose transport system substrate-binding protein
MTRYKRYLTLAPLPFLLLAITPPRATASTHPAKPSGLVTVWTEWTAGGQSSGFKALIAAWNAKHTGITIKHRPIGNDVFFTVIRTGLAGGEPPDLLQYEGYQQTRDFAAAGHLLDLTSWWNVHKNMFVLPAAAERACSYQGRMYCFPFTYYTGWEIYYNPGILAKYHIAVPKTWDEFLTATARLKKNGVTPIALGDKDGWPGEHWFMNFLVQRCGVATVYKAINQNGAKWTDPCFVQSASDFQALQTKGYFSPGATSDDFGAGQAYFLAGKAAFFQTGSWFASGWASSPPPFKVGIMPFPRMKDAPYHNDVTGAVTDVWGIPSKGKNPQAARAFLEWMFTPEATKIWAQNGNMSMVTGAVDKYAPPVIRQLFGLVEHAHAALPWIENELPPGVGEDKVYNGTVALLSGTMTPAQFCKSIQSADAAYHRRHR